MPKKLYILPEITEVNHLSLHSAKGYSGRMERHGRLALMEDYRYYNPNT